MNIHEYLQQKNPDYETGVEILAEHNPRLARVFTGRSHRYARKLIYELKKIARKDTKPTSIPLTRPVKTHGHLSRPIRDVSQSSPPVKTHGRTSQPIQNKPQSPKPRRGDMLVAPGVSRGTNDELPTTGKPQRGSTPASPPIPPQVENVVKEHARLFQLRSQLAEQRAKVPERNTQPNNKRRKALSEAIQELSEKIELLYQQKEQYYENNIIPGTEPQTPFADYTMKELTHRRKLTKKYINDIRTELDYSALKKADKKNPLPPGKKRDRLTEKLHKHQENLKYIEIEIQKR